MSVRVWQSRNGSDMWSDWEMECTDHPDEHSTSPTWIWAMELAWGHIAMHHPTPARRLVFPEPGGMVERWDTRKWLLTWDDQ